MESTLLSDGYIDLQVNGYAGVDFNDPTTPVERLCFAAEQMQVEGVAWALPTVITAAADVMCRCLQNLRSAVEQSELAAQVFRGVHIEGPFISAQPGYIGAHPPEHASKSDLGLLNRLCDAAGDRLRIVTLSPEVDVDGKLTEFCIRRGVQVAAGHTDASLADLDRCLDQGLSLFTHLGNGCPRQLDRHDNIIYRVLARVPRLRITLIADGFHVPEMLFRHLLAWIPADRLAVVSDAISAAGLGPGVYRLGNRSVAVGPDKAARDPSGEHFVGSAASMRDADVWLSGTLGLDILQRKRLLCTNANTWFPTSL